MYNTSMMVLMVPMVCVSGAQEIQMTDTHLHIPAGHLQLTATAMYDQMNIDKLSYG